ncbi:MAG: DinB family protein [Candidatus Nealsonbacteria bacterium]|nr:DinB family protein [Candidatus Nealsonbacteria bacterium]
MSRVEMLVGQIQVARQYTASLLDGTDSADWFRSPAGGVTHIAWQVGHIAVAQYYLTMQRIRGKRPADAELISDEFMQLFGKGSTPEANPEKYASPNEIRRVFDSVYQQAIHEVRETSDSVLDEPTDPPHPMFSTKFGALAFCPQHEMLHAGQIGLLRRLLGCEPLR